MIGVHSHPKYYNKPELFNPDRWLNDKLNEPFAYIPFSAGIIVKLFRLKKLYRITSSNNGLKDHLDPILKKIQV